IAGFPWHPHRGIETITYMLHGRVEHMDSLDNKGVIEAGGVQWMTAGSGIIHQEMPEGEADGYLHGFQLWANLPAANKMMFPRYQEFKSKEIPEVTLDNSVSIKIICGEIGNVSGPVKDVVIDPQYLEISMPSNTEFQHAVPDGYTVFTYVVEGEGVFGTEGNKDVAGSENLVLYEEEGKVVISTEEKPIRFLLISGKPIGEPIAWYGPIVMNTREELETAFEEYRNETFLKHQN
ncbi:MAG: pirin family protein, partial [Cyclobacteriaceae bacterium]|nr:pirin family protein [Cyclobacteriaceae bacterium]